MSTLASGEINLDRLTVSYQEHSSRNGTLIPAIPDDLTDAKRTQLTLELEKAEERLRKGRAHYARLFEQEILMEKEIEHFLASKMKNS